MGLMNLLNKLKEEDRIKGKIYYNDKTSILCSENDCNNLMGVLCRKFDIDNCGKAKELEIHNEDIYISIKIYSQSMGREEAFIKSRTYSICSHFYNVQTIHTDIKTNLLYKINMTKSIISIKYSFVKDDEFDKKAFIENIFASILNEINGIMLICADQEDSLYCQSPDENRIMELILSDKGRSTLLNYVPYEEFLVPYNNNEISDEQIERRKRTRNIIFSKYIYVQSWYPLIESESELLFRTPEEIAERAIALMIVSVYSECRLSDNLSYNEAYTFIKGIINLYDADKMFSPKERKYINNPHSNHQEQVKYSWKYESLLVLEWALGLVDNLDFPDHICNVPLTIRLIRQCSSITEILEKAVPRSHKEILDECDLIFCLDYVCADTRVNGLNAPAGLDSGIVAERNKVLNWLIGAGDREEWDEIGE